MVKRILALLVGLTVAASGLEPVTKSVESYLCVDPINPTVRSKLDFNSSVGLLVGSSYAVLSPRGTVYANGNFDGNFGLGIRTPLDTYTLGFHLFYDYSKQSKEDMTEFFQQGGFSAEFVTDDVDVRVNYYAPVLSRSSCPFYKSEMQHWVETEILYKLPQFTLGLNPVYNIGTNALSLKPKVIFPLPYGVVEAGVHLSQNVEECSSYLSLIVPIYQVGKPPVHRASSVRVSQDVFPYHLSEKKSLWQSLTK